QEAIDHLNELMERLPTQTKRTEEQNKLQQYSSPHSHAFTVSWVANLQEGDVVLEPSAGTGNLAIHALKAGVAPKNIHVNEISDRRHALLGSLFENVTKENAAHIDAILPGEVKPTVVIMNPPFSADVNKAGKKDLLVGGRHVKAALERLEDGGRLVAILGKGMAMDRPLVKEWWDGIMGDYNVRANIQVSGNEYRKFGTTFDNQFIVIDKNGATADPEAIITGRVESVKDLPELLGDIRGDRRQQPRVVEPSSEGDSNREGDQSSDSSNKRDIAGEDQRTGPAGAGDTGGGVAVDPTGVPVRGGGDEGVAGVLGDAGRDGVYDRDTGAGVGGDNGRTDGGEPGREDNGGSNAGGGAVGAGREDVRRDNGAPDKSEAERGREKKRAAVGYDNQPSVANLHSANWTGTARTSPPPSPSQQNASKDDQLTDRVYSNYEPSVKIEGSKPHPEKLEESAAMSAVDAPGTSYEPSISQDVIESGKLSDAQMETIIRAGDAHSKHLPNGERRGFFVGDGTGVGKGAQIAGIIEDNRAKGRKKAVWVSLNKKLADDAQRDIDWVGGDVNETIMQSKQKAGAPITAESGTIFATYSTLAKKPGEGKESRLDQLVNWLGEDFDGVIALDEVHKLKNSSDKKGKRGIKKASVTALAGIDLQRRLPQARFVYVSATAATEVADFGYAERLGLWGEGTAFADKQTFIANIESGGVAAMEVVAKDMKAAGSYTSRSLSYDGVEYDMLTHELSNDQTETYDTLAGAWQEVLRNVSAATEAAGGGNAAGAFWSAHQSFANQVLIGMQMPSVITDIEKQLAAGHSVVLQLVNTNAATLERRMEQARSQGLPLDEIDITPRDILMQFLQNSFPVAQYETYTTDDGSERSRVVVDSKGNAVLNPQAVRMRDNLLMKIATIDVPEGPLEQLFNHFGSEAIAEVTGRKERLVRQKDGSMVLEKLSSKTIEKDVEQYNEGKKRILAFSQAGGTGNSYHASRKFKNQQKRVHYLLQAGWEADKAVQGLGRTHRTDQAQPPQYRLVTTNMKAQMRFIATIARRLGQLGALTKGQRDTGSQGIFSEDMNLESEYGRAAIRTLTDDLVAGRVEGITLGEFMDQTAIEFIDSETGEVIESKKPTVQTFMNRLLSLKSEDMNRLFSAFHDRMEAAVAHAKEQGTFDQGMETITADKITKLDDQPVGTGGTRYVKVETENPAQHVEFDMLTPKTEFYRNSKSGKLYGISDALSVTDTKTGRIVQRKRRTSPSGGDYITVEELSKKYMPDNGSVQEHRQEWGEDLAKLSPIRKSNIHMIVGELLPIWDRLPSNQPKIYRMQSDDGEVLLGRV
ncbi:MAG: hypothetical protein HN842_08625, partial [Gammaproteobacteria bacterium]|nr:hypothetical protein [Gammaproteobacteria bacterium]